MSAPRLLDLPSGAVWCELRAGGGDLVPPHVRRRLEHDAGRRAAATGLLALGGRRTSVASTPSGVPRFPAGFAGSIAHDRGLAAAVVVAAVAGFGGVGADLHHLRPMSADEAAYIADEGELRAADVVAADAGPQVVFALKEAVFKAVSSERGDWLEFSDIRVLVRAGGRAELERPTRPGALLRWTLTASVVRAVALLPATPPSAAAAKIVLDGDPDGS